MRQPAHDQFVTSQQLHAIDAEVHPLFFRAAGDHQRPGYQRANILRPAGLYGESREVHVLISQNDLLAGRLLDDVGTHGQYFFKKRRLVDKIFEAFWWIGLSQVGE